MTIPRASQHPRKSWVTTYQPCCTTASESQHIKTQKGCTGKGCWPTRGFVASPGVGLRATVGTLRTGYLRVQAPSQDNGSRLPARGSFEAAMSSRGSGSHSRLGAAPGPPRAPTAQGSTGSTTCPSSSGQLRGHHVSLGLQHPASSAGQLRSCHMSPGLCGLQANKQISSGDLAIMISIGAGAPISSKVLCDKGCSACSQGRRLIKCR
jgi:hypothetical protein